MSDDPPPELPMGIDPVASRRIFLMMLALVIGASVAYRMARDPAGPPPAALANDPLLVAGRGVYLARCVACHGPAGRGDGPLARDLAGPPVGNFTDAAWKHGDRPEQVLAVIARGVPDTRMQGWGTVLDPPDLRAVAAYVYHLAGRPVPAEYRSP